MFKTMPRSDLVGMISPCPADWIGRHRPASLVTSRDRKERTMNGDFGAFVAILDAQRLVRAQVEFSDPRDEQPSRIRRAVVALGQRFASILTKERDLLKRRDSARHVVASGD